ncbi:Tetratricopeptide repeat-containing protein [Cyclonatronum proteinivorum]|uniref:Tetratricopeptide repeat-containing protein n=2 Tax=Cyclonatronum proteinivorum TaxID=1457365 RepID=A0A345UI60_9BACT|nr:Tetratricopeptide repeat-containing protein [Cyclonatronum proteinivorum]
MVILVMAFGFIFSCSSTSHFERAETYRAENNLTEALRAANQAVANNPDDAEAHLFIAEVVAELSKNFSPKDRKPLYRDMVKAADNARTAATEETHNEINRRADEILESRRQVEDQGAQTILSSNETLGEENRRAAIAHLENNRILSPEDNRIYETLFELYYELDDFEAATETLAAMYEAGFASSRHITTLGFLYYQSGQYEEAVPFLSRSWNDGAGLINSGRGLANALTKLGRQDEAAEILERLSRLDGQTVESKLAYGRVLAETGFAQLQEILALSPGNTSQAGELYAAAMETFSRAEVEMEAAYVLNQDHLLTNKTIGIWHRNLAFMLREIYELQPELSGTERQQQLEEHFYQSLNYLEFVTEQNPADTQTWAAMADVYEALSMFEEAEAARAQAGTL